MTTTALVIIDVQVDFCTGGSLAVPDAEVILPIVNGLMRDFHRVILTQDWHPPGHISFASSHPGRCVFDRITLPAGEQILWPDHCVQHTPGAEFVPTLQTQRLAGVSGEWSVLAARDPFTASPD